MKEYKRCLDIVRKHLKDETSEFDNETLEKLVSNELQKPAIEMDKSHRPLPQRTCGIHNVFIRV